jgi:NAD(P)-dependent dehydrogenase (short-subunit alcohol dehydrogenase family)
MDIADHGFLVAGGSSGLGAACVRRLASRGAYVTIADINPQGVALADELGERIQYVAADVTSEQDVRQALAIAQRSARGLRGVVTCAGVLHAERVLAKTGVAELAAFRRVLEINLLGTFNVVRLAAEAISRASPDDEGERGVLITTASVAAYEGQIGQAAYAASKGGVAAMTLPIARELARYGVRIVCIAPGVFETPLMHAVPDQSREALAQQTPFPARFGYPDEFAQLVQQVIENRMLNGTVIRIDGALRMPAK